MPGLTDGCFTRLSSRWVRFSPARTRGGLRISSASFIAMN